MLSAKKLTIIDISVVPIRIFKYSYFAYLLIIMYSN